MGLTDTPKVDIPGLPGIAPRTPEQGWGINTLLQQAQANLGRIGTQASAQAGARDLFQSKTGLTPESWSVDQALKQAQGSNQFRDLFQQALHGQMPVSESLKRSIEEENQGIAEKQRRMGQAGTSVGNRELADVSRRQIENKEADQWRWITAGLGQGYGAPSQTYAPQTAAITQEAAPVQLADLLNQGNTERAMQERLTEAQYGLAGQAAMADAQNKAAMQQGLWNLGGYALGTSGSWLPAVIGGIGDIYTGVKGLFGEG